jgi:imidazolonepropionase-like amidohydrolase
MIVNNSGFGAQANTILRGANVLDESGAFAGPTDVQVKDGRVAAVGKDLRGEGKDVDFAGLFVMPGVFDTHNHLTLSSLDTGANLNTPVSEWALEGAANARKTLAGGVTFVRDVGGADAGFRDAIAKGFVPGPRVQVSINLISQTGGHGDGFLRGIGYELTANHLTPDFPGRPPHVVDGVDEMRKAVRMHIRSGADWIKLATTGGLGSDYGGPSSAQFSYEEIEMAVIEAARHGRKVCAHANGGEGLDNALNAGVPSIEHGRYISEEQAKRMGKDGIFLVPTLAIWEAIVRWAKDGRMSPAQTKKILELDDVPNDTVRIAKEYGVPMAIGSDYSDREQHGNNLEEIALMREAGLTPEEALLAATINGAKLCGVDDQYGRIAPGYIFDAVVFDDDPGDLSGWKQPGAVKGVFQGGVPVIPHKRITDAA